MQTSVDAVLSTILFWLLALWSRYKINCTTVYTQVFPHPIPNGIAVPHYAYLDVDTDNIFNATLAQAAGGPESTRLPTPTSTSSRNTATSTTSGSTASKTINVGAIAGGVVGGVVGLVLIVGLIIWLRRGRRKIPSPPSSPHVPIMASQNAASIVGASYPSSLPSSWAQKVYDPNDPTTFPSDFPSPVHTTYNLPNTPPPEMQQQLQPMALTQIAPNITGTTNTSFPSVRPQYSGAPEL